MIDEQDRNFYFFQNERKKIAKNNITYTIRRSNDKNRNVVFFLLIVSRQE